MARELHPCEPMHGEALFLVDTTLPSYMEAAQLYRAAFSHAAIDVCEQAYATMPRSAQGWVIHHTIGPRFAPVGGAHNTAVVFHEWDRYPAAWVATLNQFQSVWAPSRHVAETLRVSGVRTPIDLVPPPVAASPMPVKQAYAASAPFRFLSIGEAHFRKGFHLLIDGFLAAFPEPDTAMLTIKTSASCAWASPRPDIVIVADRLNREDVESLYAEHDAYVATSLGEGLGLPVAEAVMAGLPVAANLWGGHADLVQPATCWPIAHELVPQVFSSDPSYFAAGQRCAWSSSRQVAAVLRALYVASPQERERRAAKARSALETTHGLRRVADLVRRHFDHIVAGRLVVAS
jgi:glycosyltransferase involved in cell wall biosynthesis